MYVYFDKNGRLLEIIDEPIRKGSSNTNFIYVYFDNNLTISSLWAIFKKADGTLTTETKIETFENRTIPDNLRRDLKYFEENKTYKFAKITILDDVLSQDGLALCTVRLALSDSSIFALGEIPFNIENNVILETSDITYSQYNYLITLWKSFTTWEDIESYIGVSREDLEGIGSYDWYLKHTYIEPLLDYYVEKDGDYVKFDMSARKTTIKFYKSDISFTGIEGEQTEEATLEPSKISLIALQNNSKATLKLYSNGKLEITKQDNNFEVLNTSDVLTDDDLDKILI